MTAMTIQNLSQKVLLVILDGYGIRENSLKNAIENANKPFINYLFNNYPFQTIESSGELVGLPKGVMGNSEVGHLNIGSGRSVRQDLVRINEAIENDTLKDQDQFNQFVELAKKNNNYRIHLMGLLSDGKVHSDIEHLKHLIKKFKKNNQKFEIYLHAFMDGRDTPNQNGIKYLAEIEKIKDITIGSIQGRSIGMDRDRRWGKIESSYLMMTGKANINKEISAIDYVKNEYKENIFDEFITPVLFNKDYAFKENDNIFFFNFRPDRAKQITLCLADPNFKEFKRDFTCKNYLCMTPYVQEELPNLPILFDKEKIAGTLSKYLSDQGKKTI